MNTRMTDHLSAWSALLSFLLGGFTIASAAEYEVDGQLEQRIYNLDASVGALEKSQFTVFVKDCSWLIRTTQSDTNGKPVGATETACVNGTEIYQVSGFLDGKDTVIGQGSRFHNQASIVSNNVPIGRTDGYFLCHIWLMFASGCYFQTTTTNLLTPVYDSNASADVLPNLKLKAEWDLVDGLGSLPIKVTYYQPGYKNTEIAATYLSTGMTNAGTIKIPSGFVFELRTANHFDAHFLPGPRPLGESMPSYYIRKRAVATVTAVRPYCSRTDLTPVAKGKTMVLDQRPLQTPDSKASPTNLTYYVGKDGVEWLPLDKAKKAYVVPGTSSKPASLKPVAPKPVQSKPVSRGIVAIILLVPLAVISLFWWLNRKKE